MIRFLQKDNRLTKALFVVIIAAASVSMVVYLIPGLTGQGASGADTFAVVYPHWYSRYLSAGDVISQQKVQQLGNAAHAAAVSAVCRQSDDHEHDRAAGGPAACAAADPAERGAKAGHSRRPTRTCGRICRPDPPAQVLFPNGQFIGQDKYAQLIREPFRHDGCRTLKTEREGRHRDSASRDR